MRSPREDKYERFRSALEEPYDRDPNRIFPIYTTNQHFDLSDYAGESANGNVAIFDHLVQSHPDDLFMDLGCGRRDKTFDNCLYVEVYPSTSADLIVAPTCRYPIKDGSLKGIGCFAVLEHTRQPWVVVQEMYRMLAPGGRVMIDWPFLQPVHGYPSHFFNATREGLTSIFSDQGFSIDLAYTGAHQTVAYTLQWILGALNHNLPPDLQTDLRNMSVGGLMDLHQHDERWQRFVNALSPSAQAELACGNMLVATKEAA